MSEPSPPPGMVRPPLPAAAALLAAALLHCAPAAPARRHKPVSRDHPVTLSPVIPPILSPPPTPPPEALRYSSEGSIAPTSRSRDAGTGSSDALPGVTGRGTMSRRCGPPPPTRAPPAPLGTLGKFSQACSLLRSQQGKTRERDEEGLREDTGSPLPLKAAEHSLPAKTTNPPLPASCCAGNSQKCYGETRLKG